MIIIINKQIECWTWVNIYFDWKYISNAYRWLVILVVYIISLCKMNW